MIELRGVTKTYGDKKTKFTALDAVDLDIEEGSSVAIVGKSGSGKSTLMHVMSGLDGLTSGTIQIGGESIGDMKQKRRDQFRAKSMGFIFQAFFVQGNESCYDNVAMALEIAGTPSGERRKLITDALEQVDLADKVKSKAKNLSGGQKQRLAIARAIVNKPKLLFADEPTGNLDSTTSDVIEDLLFNLNKELKCTLVIVTHDQELAEKCDMQVYLKDGKLQKTVGGKK